MTRMTRWNTGWVAVMAVAPMLMTGGCADKLKAKDAHIALLEDTNQRLTEKLANAQQSADQITNDREQCSEQLRLAQADLTRLRSQRSDVAEPSAPAGWQTVPGGAMIALEGGVLFKPGKVDLRNNGRTGLDAITSTIRSRYPEKDIYVFGHTDDTPIRKSGWKDNYELSAQRALTVVRYLGEHGIDRSRLVACGAGEHRPRVPNSDGASRAKNRRVEIFAVDPIH